MNRMHYGLLSLALSLSSPLAMAKELKSGMYEALQLAVSADNQVTGYYNEGLGGGNSDCRFYIAGRVVQGKAGRFGRLYPLTQQ